jgi:hypothetical protein
MKKQILFILTVILSVSVGYSTLCYQETANQPHLNDGICELNFSGGYFINGSFYFTGNFNDANITTGTAPNYSSKGYHYIYFNYSKPLNALPTSLVQVTLHKEGSVPTYQTENISILSTCWNQDYIQF